MTKRSNTCPDLRTESPDYECPECPVCGSECEIIYTDINGDIAGCDVCIGYTDAWVWLAERLEEERWFGKQTI